MSTSWPSRIHGSAWNSVGVWLAATIGMALLVDALTQTWLTESDRAARRMCRRRRHSERTGGPSCWPVSLLLPLVLGKDWASS